MSIHEMNLLCMLPIGANADNIFNISIVNMILKQHMILFEEKVDVKVALFGTNAQVRQWLT